MESEEKERGGERRGEERERWREVRSEGSVGARGGGRLGDGEGEEDGRWRGGREADRAAAGTYLRRSRTRRDGTDHSRRGWMGSRLGLTRSGVAGGRGRVGKRSLHARSLQRPDSSATDYRPLGSRSS